MGRFLFLLVGLFAFSACHLVRWEEKSVSDGEVKVARYDRLQYEAVTLNSVTALQKMSLEFPQATKLLIEDVLELGTVGEPAIINRLCAYYADTTLLRLMDDVQEEFHDLSDIEQGLTDGFRRLRKSVPDLVVPRVYAQVSALNQSVVVTDSLLGISLDKYMGADYPLYPKYYYPNQYRSMERRHIVPDCFLFFLMGRYPFGWHPGHRTLLDQLMYRGKIFWVVSRLVDGMSEEDLLGYTPEEKAWCKENGRRLWEEMKDNGYLYSTDPMLVRAFTYPASSPQLEGKPVPPMAGTWIGIQLVKAYLKQHPETSVEELLGRSDFGDPTLLTPY